MLFKRLLRPFAYNNEISRAVNDIMVETDKINETVKTIRKDVDGTFNDVNISGTHLVFDKVGGEQKEIELPSNNEWASITSADAVDRTKLKIGSEILFASISGTNCYIHGVAVRIDGDDVYFSASGKMTISNITPDYIRYGYEETITPPYLSFELYSSGATQSITSGFVGYIKY